MQLGKIENFEMIGRNKIQNRAEHCAKRDFITIHVKMNTAYPLMLSFT